MRLSPWFLRSVDSPDGRTVGPFTPLGPTSLRGVPGAWELFEVGSSDR
jgi:hypothetical protein